MWLILSIILLTTTKVSADNLFDYEYVRTADSSGRYLSTHCNQSGYFPLIDPNTGWASNVFTTSSTSYITARPKTKRCETKRQYWINAAFDSNCSLPGTELVPPAGLSGSTGWMCGSVACASVSPALINCSLGSYGTLEPTCERKAPPRIGTAWSTDPATGAPVCGPTERPSFKATLSYADVEGEFWPYCYTENGGYGPCSSEYPAGVAGFGSYLDAGMLGESTPFWKGADQYATWSLGLKQQLPCYEVPRWLNNNGQLSDTTSTVQYSTQIGQWVATTTGTSYGDQAPVYGQTGWVRVQVPTTGGVLTQGDYGWPWCDSGSFAGVGRTFTGKYCGAQQGDAKVQWGPQDAQALQLLHPLSWSASSDPECLCFLDSTCVPHYGTKRPKLSGLLEAFSIAPTPAPNTAPAGLNDATTNTAVVTLPPTAAPGSTTTTTASTGMATASTAVAQATTSTTTTPAPTIGNLTGGAKCIEASNFGSMAFCTQRLGSNPTNCRLNPLRYDNRCNSSTSYAFAFTGSCYQDFTSAVSYLCGLIGMTGVGFNNPTPVANATLSISTAGVMSEYQPGCTGTFFCN